MKIILQPDPKCLETFRKNEVAVSIAQKLLRALGVLELATKDWDQPHHVKFNPEETVQLLGMLECHEVKP